MDAEQWVLEIRHQANRGGFDPAWDLFNFLIKLLSQLFGLLRLLEQKYNLQNKYLGLIDWLDA